MLQKAEEGDRGVSYPRRKCDEGEVLVLARGQEMSEGRDGA